MRTRLACLATLVVTGQVWGQSLAELVPADSLIYVGWKGTAEPGKGYAGSRLAAVLKDAQLGRVIDESLPAMGTAAQQKWPQYAGQSQAITSVVRQLIRRPSAAFMDFADERPRGGFLCRAGADNKAITQALEKIVPQLPAMLKARVVTPGDSVGLVLGYEPDAAVEGGLDQVAAFKAGLAHCLHDPEVAAFINFKLARGVIDEAVARNATPENAERYRKFMEASGFEGLNAFTSADGFAGRDWRSDSFIDAPMPRKGLLATATNAPIDADLLKHVPASSYSVTVMRLNAAEAVKTIRDVAAATDPAAGDAIDKGLGAATMAIGKNVQTDLLASLGEQWAVYSAPEIGGSSLAGLVVVNKLANPLKAKQSIAAAAMFVTNTAQNLLRAQKIAVALRTIRVGNLTVYYTATPLIAPSWIVQDGYLYVGMYPQTVIAAAKYGGASIADNEAFKSALTGDAATPLVATYTDVKATLGDGYGGALALTRTFLGMSDMFLAPTAEPALPSLGAMLAEATPATSAFWADDAGMHSRNVSPFPGAVGISQLSAGSMLANNAPALMSTILPALQQAQVAGGRVKSMSNLRQIGLACLLYANENQNQFPPDFGALIKTQEITADVFLNPQAGTALPPVPPGVRPVDFYGPWVAVNSDYVYAGAGKTSNEAADHIVAYEKPAGMTDGINVLFFDGHVEFVAMPLVPSRFQAAGLASPLP